MKKLCLSMIVFAAVALAAEASTIVRWSVPGGTNNIVTDRGPKGAAAGSTYAVVSPADGAGGYSTNVAGQTRIVYGASTKPWNNTLVQNLNPDYMQLVNNFSGAVGTFTTMLAWEDFLTNDSELESMTVMYGSRGGVGTTASFLIETSAGWYKSVQNNFQPATSFTTWTRGVADLTWESFSDPGFSGITGGVGPADITDIQSAGVYFSAENSAGNNWAGSKVAYFEVTATEVSIVQSNTTYATVAEAAAVTSSNDLANQGQATFDTSTVTANQGGETPEESFNDGVTAEDFANMTWFHNGNGHLPGIVTLNLDATANTDGYDISEINSICGWGSGEQADQVVTVEYSLVGNAGFSSLGTFTNTVAGAGEYSRLNLTKEGSGYLARGVDALRLTYAATGLNLVLQEIDIIGDAVVVPIQLQPASMFSDDMILQRDNAVPVWGTSDPGAAITVEFAGQTKVTTAASNGTWRVDLDPMAASTNARTLTVTAELDSKTTQVSFSNVLVGEVWLCSGQSNMAWTLDKTDNGPAVVAAANHPTLRLFKVPQVSTTTPLERIDAVWTECTPETAGGSFGVAYYFARTLQTELDVPVGLMMSARGGTAIELWYPGSGGYYNGMIDALIPFAMRGVIWYQGENNVTDGMLYVDKKKHLVNSWRDLWGYEFPFYYVQLAPFNYGGGRDGTLPYFWEAQSAILGVITNTGMAVITDTVTNLNGIHPTNKEGPGIRLALLALDNTYGLDIVSTGPVFQSLETVSNTLQVTFDSSDGLTTSDSLAPDWFELEVSDGVYTAAAAVVSNNLVILSATGVDVPTAMRFAWSEIAQPNLRNSAGLVASAFRAELGPFGLWTVEFGLSGSNALYTADPDGDVLDNLGEYALGGNPTNGSDRGYVPIFGPLEENGTNWFEYVYARRRDAAARGLDYTVEATSNLVSAAWSTNNITETGAVAIDGDFEWVTNRIPLYVQGFLHLMIELVE